MRTPKWILSIRGWWFRRKVKKGKATWGRQPRPTTGTVEVTGSPEEIRAMLATAGVHVPAKFRGTVNVRAVLTRGPTGKSKDLGIIATSEEIDL